MPALIWVWLAFLTQSSLAAVEHSSTSLAVQNANDTSARCNRELSRQARAILEKVGREGFEMICIMWVYESNTTHSLSPLAVCLQAPRRSSRAFAGELPAAPSTGHACCT
jgi:hypothetical protein